MDLLHTSLFLADANSVLNEYREAIKEAGNNFDGPTLQELIISRWRLIRSQGFTYTELQYALASICVLRFVIYSIIYNPITSFKLSAIGALSCLVWIACLNDLIRGYRISLLQYNKFFARILVEHKLYVKSYKSAIEGQIMQRNLNFMVGEYDYGWLKPLFDIMPDKIRHITDPMYKWIGTQLNSTILTFRAKYLQNFLPIIQYTMIVRVGKKYCPYHLRWHYTFGQLYQLTVRYFFACVQRANLIVIILINKGHIKQAAEWLYTLNVIQLAHLIFLILAALHAVCGQYFYVPLMTQCVELHVGKRPLNSIYSGGYTAWQDDYTFYNITYRQVMTLWWGWLGRGSKKHRERHKRGRRRKRKE